MKRLLIANRGEIALRILRACQTLGIETVAAYTKADVGLLHLRYADEIVCVGADSYLDADQLLAAAVSRKCEAIHPGYGFLAENADFAEKVEAEGLIFVGPTPGNIRLMADKAKAREFMAGTAVPVLPGSVGQLDDLEQAVTIAARIGYPVMLKAVHGGGGRGIVAISHEQDLRREFESIVTQSEILFGSPAVYVEKCLVAARHIEIQVFGDGHGKVVHLGARECSVQRRNQKLIEEAPPSGISQARIESLSLVCCEALAGLKYRNAGTVEFLFHEDQFYFIEMNTRIQVEHPVTECVTDVDLVRLQLELACGREMTLQQDAMSIRGHCIECRINAEDDDFLPAPGTVSYFHAPGGPGVRLDSHLYSGYKIPYQYDSLMGKLICFGHDRDESIQRMRSALNEIEIRGVPVNTKKLIRILDSPEFIQGHYNTDLIANLS